MKCPAGQHVLALIVGCIVALSLARADEPAPEKQNQFVVELPAEPKQNSESVSGRLFVFLSTKNAKQPRLALSWFTPEPFFANDVRDFQPGERSTIDDTADGFPDRLSQLPAGTYYAQALLDTDLDHHDPARAPGNRFSPPVKVDIDPHRPQTLNLRLTEFVEQKPFPATRWHHELRLRSPLLSKFHQRNVEHLAGVLLPASYFDQPEQCYPVIYFIPGFGGTHHAGARFREGGPPAEEGVTEFVRVYLTGECKWGHHCFADSETNGPRATALVRELIPYIDANYRTVSAGTARFLSGHSSGGWATLWLQVTYPELFAGVWSTAPDSVGFHDFEQVDLYRDDNLYRDTSGKRRPIAHRNGKPVLWFDSFCKMDDVLARGGQMRSFEAVFSRLGTDGQPQRMWNRATGQIDRNVVRDWSRYDIRETLEQRWSDLGPKLAGKLHIWVGDQDTFYLNRAVELLKTSLARHGSDAEIRIVPNRNHSDLTSPQLHREFRRQMSEVYLRRHPAESAE